jgi:cysteinyl-tRNA synthetase
LVKAAKKEKKTAWDIAKFYTDQFLKDIKVLNIKRPDVLPRATDHIREQIEIIKVLEEKGFTYKTSDGVYFSTREYEEKTGRKYGELSTLDEIKEGARVEKNPEKKDKRDFALWKFSKKSEERHMEWQSPWGVGFPGWHIECSAMSMKYLGESFDIHVGGEDLRQTHHPNEIVQSEAATGEQYVRYWVHSTFLLVDGKRMGKSLDNIYTLSDLKEKSLDPITIRYLYLTAHYRDPLNFTWESFKSASRAYDRLRTMVVSLKQETTHGKRIVLSKDKLDKTESFQDQFARAINSDLNTPKALAIMWKVLKSNMSSLDKYELVLAFDEIFGLGLMDLDDKDQIPEKIDRLLKKREKLRGGKKFSKAD